MLILAHINALLKNKMHSLFVVGPAKTLNYTFNKENKLIVEAWHVCEWEKEREFVSVWTDGGEIIGATFY